jgi:hypothetical protein
MTENNLLEVLAPVGDMERLYAAQVFCFLLQDWRWFILL